MQSPQSPPPHLPSPPPYLRCVTYRVLSSGSLDMICELSLSKKYKQLSLFHLLCGLKKTWIAEVENPIRSWGRGAAMHIEVHAGISQDTAGSLDIEDGIV